MDHVQRSHGLTFLFSDQTPLPDRFFHGFAFVGRDYVFGDQGALDYEAANGSPILAGEDGCYVTVVRQGQGHYIGADHGGLKKLFYYRQGSAWCVSNSLVLLVEHLRSRGVALTLNFPQMIAFRASGTFASQMATTATVFNEIRLLPTTWTLRIGRDGLGIERAAAGEPESYRDALDRYVSTWLSRLKTVLGDERTWVNSDLSGGRDSRTVFALVSAATADSDRSRVRLQSSSSAAFAADLDAAQNIADHYGWELNRSLEGRPPLMRFSEEERYMGWRDLSLGAYLPVYFPDRRPNPWVMDLHGGGGENHRPFYPGDGLEDQVSAVHHLRPSYLAEAWKQDVLRSEAQLAEAWPGIPPLVSHYREFRNRFHSGLIAQYRTVLTPLGARHLDLLSRHPEKVETGQINFDIMESLVPGLMNLPYDADKKLPTAANLANLTTSDLPYGSEPGTIYGTVAADGRNAARTPNGHLLLMSEELESVAGDRLVRDLVGDEVIAKARDGIAKAVEHGRFMHAADAKDVSRVLMAGFVFASGGLA